MMTWFKFMVQDYMSPEPEVEFRSFNSENDAKEWATKMSTSAWSGNVTFKGVANPDELLKFAKEIKADQHVIDEIIEWKNFINK